MMIIAKLKRMATIEEMMDIQRMLKKQIEEGAVIYDSEHIELTLITDKTKEEYHAI